jgi:hypothetical protein
MHDISPTTPTVNEHILSVTDGRQTIGFLISRGKLGVEAFDADEKSIGLFANVQAAATECWKHAHGQPLNAEVRP